MKTNNKLTGTNSLFRTLLVGVVMLGGSLMAAAQSGGGGGAGKVSVHDIHFNMVELKPANPELGFKAETIEVGLLVPAVQKIREAAARVKLSGDGWDLTIPVFGHGDRTRVAKIVLWTTEAAGAPAGESLILNIKDQSGQTRQVRIPSMDIAISVLPTDMDVLSASAKHTTVNELTLGDGSVRPILIGMLLPAIQKVR